MTNIANKIYNHATVLAGNLRAKGVPDITANMGLADLIDKVLDIDQTSNGLYLFSDKKIAQSGNTINLSSMILEDKQIKPGETITFYYTFLDKKMKVNEEIQIPSQFQNYDWDITIEKTSASGQIRLPKKNISEYILLGASSITLPSNQVIPVNNPCYKIRGNVIYFDDNSISISADFDKTWVSNSLASTHVSITTLIPVVVQNNGLATYSMTCDGSGKKSFYTTYGNFVSEPYNVWDCIKFDKGILNDADTHDIYDSRNQNSLLTRTENYTSLTEVNTGTDAIAKASNMPTACSIELDYCCVNGNIASSGLNFYDVGAYKQYISLQNIGYSSSILGEWVKLKITYENGSITMTSLDDTTKTITKTYTGNINAIALITSGTVTEVRWKNLKIYSI